MKKLIALAFAFVLAFTIIAYYTARERVSEKFIKMLSSDSYHIELKIVVGGVEIQMEKYEKKGMIAATTKAKDVTMRIIMRDNKTYMIDDSKKTVLVMPELMQALADMVKTTAVNTKRMRYVGSGKANFQGKNLPYEEYRIDNRGKSQFFVDGKKITGIRNISGSEVAEVVILALNKYVSDSVFQIPDDYTQISF